jgi:hypothetical protein
MARISVNAADVTTGSEDGGFVFHCRNGGAAVDTDWTMDAGKFLGDAAGGPRISNLNGSNFPTILPYGGDTDTGLKSTGSDVLILHAGGLDIAQVDGTVGTKGQVLLPDEDIAATPTLAWGDGDTGFYCAGDDIFCLSIGGNLALQYIDTIGLMTIVGGVARATLVDNTPTATLPTIVPDYGSDTNTGIGRAGADQLSLIAGGIEGIRITEASSITTVDIDAGDNAAPQVGALTSIKSVSATVAAATAATLTASNLIPAGSFVIGLTLRVETTFDNSSSLTTFSVGDGSDADRWGTAIARTAGTTVDLTDATASPGGWFIAANDVVLTADAGTFNVAGGSCDIIMTG